MNVQSIKRGSLLTGGGLLLLLLLVGGSIAGVLPDIPGLTDEQPVAEADENGPKPGDPGLNPCNAVEGGAREETMPAHVVDYFAMIGKTLREEGDPRFKDFDPDNVEWITNVAKVWLDATTGAPVNPEHEYWAKTGWCPGFDVAEDGDKVERKAEWVNGGKPLRYEVGKAYWILYEDEDTIVGILVDCHNLVVIDKTPPPPPTTVPPPVVTQPPPVTEPPCTNCGPPPTEPPCTNCGPPPTEPPVTEPPCDCPPPTTVPDDGKDDTESPVSSDPDDEDETVRPIIPTPSVVIRPTVPAGSTTTTQAPPPSTIAIPVEVEDPEPAATTSTPTPYVTTDPGPGD